MKVRTFSLIVALSFLMLSCSEKTLVRSAKNLNYKSINISDFGLYKSIFAEKKDLLIFTGNNDNGLVIYQPGSEQLKKLNGLSGAGNGFFLDDKEENIVFQTFSIIDFRRYSQIHIQNLENENLIRSITDKSRNHKLIGVVSGKVVFTEENKIISWDIDSGSRIENPNDITIAYSDNDLNLVVYRNGEKKILNPQGEGNYIWVSVSADFKSVLYHKTSSGTYICGLNGENIVALGNINNPKWAGTGKWIIGSEETDDGHKYQKSDIIMINAKGGKRINLTANTDIIALNPAVSSKLDRLFFNDEEGRVYFWKIGGK